MTAGFLFIRMGSGERNDEYDSIRIMGDIRMSAVTFASGLCAGIGVTALLMGGQSEWVFLLLASVVGLVMTAAREIAS